MSISWGVSTVLFLSRRILAISTIFVQLVGARPGGGPDVQLTLLSTKQWVPFRVGQFRRSEGIPVLEARALLEAVRHSVGYVPDVSV